MSGILGCGAYVPRLRLQREIVYRANSWFAPGLKTLAKGERAIANWDEDAVTMAVEAARDCLLDRARTDIRVLIAASTSFPFADRQNSGVVKEALGLPDAVMSLDVGASQKAGTGALIQALYATSSNASVLILGSEKRRARPASEDEMINGDGAASFLVGAEDGIARFLGTYSVTADFVDHFRVEGGEFDYTWEGRWVRDEGFEKLMTTAVRDALQELSVNPERVTHLVVGIPSKGVASALAKKLGIPANAVHSDLSDVLGYTGCAHALILLAHTLEIAKPGEVILVVGFGQGVDVLLFETTDQIEKRGRPAGLAASLGRGQKEDNYLKYLAFAGHLKLELGKRAEIQQKPLLTALYRHRRTVLGLIGARNKRTGTVQFPRSSIGVDQTTSLAEDFEEHPLADRMARILTFTTDYLTYSPDPPSYYGMIEFEGGGRMLAEFTDVQPAAISVGARMRMVFRMKAVDDHTGFIKYFWKAVPVEG